MSDFTDFNNRQALTYCIKEGKMNIRKATPDDVETLIELRLEFLHECEIDGGNEMETNLREYFLSHTGRDLTVFLAETDGNVAATVFLVSCEKPPNRNFPNGKTGLLLNVYTRPEYRRQGLGLSLVNKATEEARRLNLSYVQLSATEKGYPIYKKAGFTEKNDKDTPMILRFDTDER